MKRENTAPEDQWDEIYERDIKDLPWLDNSAPDKLLARFAEVVSPDSRILDYGCGDGKLANILQKKDLEVVCSDISQNALDLVKDKYPNLKIQQANTPSEFSKENKFGGILCWGVMHHVDREEWEDYMASFYNILEKDGILLIGGHSTEDKEFKSGHRISPTTDEISHAVDALGNIAESLGFSEVNTGFFEFKEAFTSSRRVFKYFFFQK